MEEKWMRWKRREKDGLSMRRNGCEGSHRRRIELMSGFEERRE